MIADGIKKEEYRKINRYYLRRLFEFHGLVPGYFRQLMETKTEEEFNELLTKDPTYLKLLKIDLLEYTQGVNHYIRYKHNYVTFYNGYRSGRDEMLCEIKSITIGTGKQEWGAEPGELYFVIKLKK